VEGNREQPGQFRSSSLIDSEEPGFTGSVGVRVCLAFARSTSATMRRVSRLETHLTIEAS
jgi:hypothetical protein